MDVISKHKLATVGGYVKSSTAMQKTLYKESWQRAGGVVTLAKRLEGS